MKWYSLSCPTQEVHVATGNGVMGAGGNGEEGSSLVRPASQMDLDIEVGTVGAGELKLELKASNEHLETDKSDPPQTTSEQDNIAEFDTTAM